jgi:hypothetical protein
MLFLPTYITYESVHLDRFFYPGARKVYTFHCDLNFLTRPFSREYYSEYVSITPSNPIIFYLGQPRKVYTLTVPCLMVPR